MRPGNVAGQQVGGRPQPHRITHRNRSAGQIYTTSVSGLARCSAEEASGSIRDRTATALATTAIFMASSRKIEEYLF